MAEPAFVQTPVLDLAYEAWGPSDGEVVVLLHGFPYDVRAYDEVAPALAAVGLRVVVPYLRGYGPTRFRAAQTPRSGQQGALAQDLVDLLDALAVKQATLVGYDWGGRAACIVAACRPERVRALVTGDGYNVQHLPTFARPADPETEHRLWYQFYFHTPRGVAGLEANRFELGKLLWRLWSPSWRFDNATYARTAASFENPDFVPVVIQSYRHRYGQAAGDPAYDALEAALLERPRIAVPTISLVGAEDGVGPPGPVDDDAQYFTGPYERRLLAGVGHNIPQEAPRAVVDAVRALTGR